MPCNDSSSSMTIFLDHQERFISFEYAKITCGQEIKADTGLNRYFVGAALEEILKSQFSEVSSVLNPKEEESQFVLYLEWDALRCALGLYVGTHSEEIDTNRCNITAIEHGSEGIMIALVVLPPKELPKIISCAVVNKN